MIISGRDKESSVLERAYHQQSYLSKQLVRLLTTVTFINLNRYVLLFAKP